LAEQKQGKLQPATLHAVTAAKQFGGPVTVLVAGKGVGQATSEVGAVEGVDSILVADDPCLEHNLAEPLSALLSEVTKK